MKREEKREDSKDLAWDAFCETGEIGLYLLYNDLKEKEVNERTKDKGDYPEERQPQRER